MQANHYLLNGVLIENGKVILQGVLSVGMSGYKLRLKEDGSIRGKELELMPFNYQMFHTYSMADITKGYLINLQGNGLGDYKNGPLGHPGDGEFDVYDIDNTSISGKYHKEGLNIEIIVNTKRGKEVCYYAKEESEEKLPSLNIIARFFVPRSQLAEFLKYNEIGAQRLMDKLDSIPQSQPSKT